MELFRVMFRMNAETPEVTALKAVASTASQLLQFGMRTWTERIITMDQVRISVIRQEWIVVTSPDSATKAVIRQENFSYVDTSSSDNDKYIQVRIEKTGYRITESVSKSNIETERL